MFLAASGFLYIATLPKKCDNTKIWIEIVHDEIFGTEL